MKVGYEMLPDQQERQKMVIQFTAGETGVDAFYSSLRVEKKRFWKAGWYEPLNPFLQNRSLSTRPRRRSQAEIGDTPSEAGGD